ncbi:Neurexin, partial [Branchiostoma belcheri]
MGPPERTSPTEVRHVQENYAGGAPGSTVTYAGGAPVTTVTYAGGAPVTTAPTQVVHLEPLHLRRTFVSKAGIETAARCRYWLRHTLYAKLVNQLGDVGTSTAALRANRGSTTSLPGERSRHPGPAKHHALPMYGVRGAVPTLIVLTWVSYAYCYYVPSRSALQFILERAQEEEEEDTTGYLLSLLRPVPTTQPSVLLDLPFEPETDLSELFKRQDDILSSGDADPEAVSERTPGRRRPYRPPKQKGRNRGKGRARSRNRGRNKNRNPNRNRNRNPNRNRNRNRNNKNGNKQKGGRPSPSAHDRRSRFVLALASLAQR